MCASCAQRTLIGSVPRVQLIKNLTRRETIAKNRPAGPPGARGGRRPSGTGASRGGPAGARRVTAETRSGSARRAYTDSTLYGAGGVTEGDRGEGKGKPMCPRRLARALKPDASMWLWHRVAHAHHGRTRAPPPPRMHFSDPALMLLLSLAPWNASAALPGCRSPSQQLIDLSLAQQPLHAGLRLPPAPRCFHLLG